jgi:hypothetical protein
MPLPAGGFALLLSHRSRRLGVVRSSLQLAMAVVVIYTKRQLASDVADLLYVRMFKMFKVVYVAV